MQKLQQKSKAADNHKAFNDIRQRTPHKREAIAHDDLWPEHTYLEKVGSHLLRNYHYCHGLLNVGATLCDYLSCFERNKFVNSLLNMKESTTWRQTENNTVQSKCVWSAKTNMEHGYNMYWTGKLESSSYKEGYNCTCCQ